MVTTTLIAIGVAGVLGLLAMLGFRLIISEDIYGDTQSISWSEYAVVFALMTAVIAPSVSAIGNALSVAQLLSYQQFVNGVEISTHETIRLCESGRPSHYSGSTGRSNCTYAYVSGHYYWEESHTREVCSGSGKDRTCRSETYYTTERANLYTPHATREHYGYTIDSSMGAAGDMSYKFPGVYLDAQPTRHPQSDRDIPGDIPRGAPADWTDADARLKAGDPRAVTKVANYDNYILASNDEVLKTYGARLEEYKSAGLLPDHTANINSDPITGPSRSQADKVSFVGVNVDDTGAWQRSLMRFNSALGMKLQGDLHVVLVDTAKVPWSDSVPYTQALKAYWQGETFGKRALAKNGIILVLGVNTQKNVIDWADASTGMPFGNESMIQYLRDNLPGKALEPTLLFGAPRTIITDGKTTVTLTTPRGVVEEIVFDKAAFKRARMSCNDDTCVGYKDLVSTIEPTFEQKTWMVVVTALISLILWVFVGMTSIVSQMIDLLIERFKSWRGSTDKTSPSDVDIFSDEKVRTLPNVRQYENYSPYDQFGRKKHYGRDYR